LTEEIRLLREDNKRIRSTKEPSRIFEVPITFSEITEAEMPQTDDLPLEERQQNNSEIEVQTEEEWLTETKADRIPEVRYIEVPVVEVIEKVVKVPYLKPIEIVDQCDIVVEKIVQVPYLQPH
jgi:hypothetical protein